MPDHAETRIPTRTARNPGGKRKKEKGREKKNGMHIQGKSVAVRPRHPHVLLLPLVRTPRCVVHPRYPPRGPDATLCSYFGGRGNALVGGDIVVVEGGDAGGCVHHDAVGHGDVLRASAVLFVEGRDGV